MRASRSPGAASSGSGEERTVSTSCVGATLKRPPALAIPLLPSAASRSAWNRSATFFVSLLVTVNRPHMRQRMTSRSAGRPYLRVLAVPLDGAGEAIAQGDLGPPAGQLAQLARVHVLPVDLPRRIAETLVVGLELRARHVGDQLEHLAHRVRLPVTGVEALPRGRAAGADRVFDREIGRDRVADVEEVALRGAVGADHRAAPVEEGGDRLRDEAGEVEVAAAEDVGETGDGDGKTGGVAVAERDHVGGSLARLIRGGGAELLVLAVGQLVLRPVGLVGGCDHHRRNLGAAAGLEQRPGAAHVDVERAARVAGRVPDDR